MTTYKEIFGKQIKNLTGDPAPTPVTFTVTYQSVGGANKYFIDGVQQKQLELYEGNTYIFDYSAASGHPFRFSTTSDGTHGGGSEYTTGVSVVGNVTTIVVASGAPNLFYYCTIHSGMGGIALTPTSPSEYEGQIWYNETTGNFRSVVAGGAWSSSASLTTYRYGGAGGGTQSAAFYGGGYKTPAPNPVDVTEEYNGNGWSTGGNMNTARMYQGGSGTQTAGLASGGDQYPSPRYSVLVEEYNGTAWSVQNVLPAANKNMGSCGLQTASLNFGGSLPTATNVNNLYDGTNWTNTGHNLNTARYSLRGAGTSAAAIAMGGDSGGNPGTATEEYNGSSWTSVSNSPGAFAAAGSAGTQTAASTFGGLGPSSAGQTTHNNYDGTTWTTAPSLATARYFMALGPIGTQSASLCVGGNGPDSAVAGVATEEYNFTANTVIPGAWASGGALNTGRTALGGTGISTAAIGMGGGAPLNVQTEEYDGASWTSTGNINTGRAIYGGAFGPQGAAGAASGEPTSTPAGSAYEEYDGSSWTSGPTLNIARNGGISLGTQTAALCVAGFTGPAAPNAYIKTSESWNGSSWTSLPTPGSDTQTAGSGASAGTTAAGLIFGRYDGAPNYTGKTDEYDGSSWTVGGVMITARYATAGSGAQTAAMVSQGYSTGTLNFAEGYDGNVWSTRPNCSVGKYQVAGAGASNTDCISFGGSGNSTATEEFTGETTSLNYKTISSS